VNFAARASRVRLSLAAKLILGFLLVAIPSVSVLGGISFYAFRDLAVVNRQLQEISRCLEALRDLETAVARTMLPPSEFLIHGTLREDQRFKTLVNEAEAQLKSYADAACHGSATQPREMAAGLVPHIQDIKERASAIFRAGESLTAQGKFHLLHEMNHHGEEVNRHLERMSSALLLRVDSLQRKSREVSQRARSLILAFTLSVLGLAILTAYLISRRLLRPVRELLSGTRHVREGDLGYRVAIVERDEIGELAQSFNAMAEELQGHREQLEKIVQVKTAELKRAQESLLQSEKLASIGLLASGIAHELNNPLTSILMNANLLVEELGEKPEILRELKRIGDDALRCKRIIDDLRDFSRRHDLDIRPSDLNDVVRSALALIHHELELHGISLREELSSQPPLVACDPDRMRQLLMNVFVNAIQAMPQGGRLTVKTRLHKDSAEISVQDTGPGIPREVRGKIFDPFFTTKEGGTGLGLSIVYRMMEEHGGRVEVESLTAEEVQAGSSEATGTRIRLVIPVKEISAQQKEIR
jgi:signal transduction histidine kinase